MSPRIVDCEAPRCPACGSSRREHYNGSNTQEFKGIRNGQAYTHIVRRYTRCMDCGQSRVDRFFENQPETQPENQPAKPLENQLENQTPNPPAKPAPKSIEQPVAKPAPSPTPKPAPSNTAPSIPAERSAPKLS